LAFLAAVRLEDDADLVRSEVVAQLTVKQTWTSARSGGEFQEDRA
jgi:hypothetical protein